MKSNNIIKCACYKSCKDCSDFYKVVSLKDIGLHIYRYRSRCKDHKLEEEDGNKTTNITSDIIIVQNTRNVDITADQYLPELEKYKICPRCKYIFDHTQKLLEKLPQVRGLDTISICDHCLTKISIPCRRCSEIVKKFASSNIQKRKLLKEIVSWLSNKKGLLGRSEKLSKLKHRSRSYSDNLYQTSVNPRSARQPQIGELVDLEDLSHLDVKQGKIRFSKKPLLIEQRLESKSESLLFDKNDKTEYDKDVHPQKFNRSDEFLSTISSTSTLSRIRLKYPSKKSVYDTDRDIVVSTQNEVSDIDLSTLNLLLNEEILQKPHKDFKYLFIKERKKESRPMSKSSTELIKEIQDRLNIEIEAEKKKQEKLKSEEERKKQEEERLIEEYTNKQEHQTPILKEEEKDRTEKHELKKIEEKIIQEQQNLTKKEKEKIKLHERKLQKIEAEGKPKEPRLKKNVKDSQQMHKIIKEEEVTVKKLEEKKKKQSDHARKILQDEKIKVHVEKDIKEVLKHDRKQRIDKPLIEDKKKERKTRDKQKPPESEFVEAQKVKKKQEKEEKQLLESDRKDKEKEEKEIIKKDKQDKSLKEKEPIQKTKEQDKTREKEEKIRQEKVKKEFEEKERSDNYLLQLQKLKAEQARQKEIETKLKEEERKREIEEAKSKAKKEAELKLKMMKETESQKPEKSKEKEKSKKKAEEPTVKEINVNEVKVRKPSTDDLILRLVRLKQSEKRKRPKRLSELNIPRRSIISHKGHRNRRSDCAICNDSDLELDIDDIYRSKMEVKEITDIIIGEKILKHKSHLEEKVEYKGTVPLFFRSIFQEDDIMNLPQQIYFASETAVKDVVRKPTQTLSKNVEQEVPRGVIRYALSDRSFIEKGWTMLPTEKVVRKMNVYRMRPAHPEFDWFEHNKSKKIMSYDTGEKLAEFDDSGRGRWFYRNGRLALDYYDAEELNAQQRFVIHSSGNPDERGRSRPLVILATFDYLGNGIVFDHTGKIRLKYNQTEGVVLDRNIGPVSHWKWHTLNDPPVLQQVMIDTQMAHKDPQILKLGGSGDDKPRPDNEEMLAIEFDNFIKEKSKKLSQKFKPFQIKMKALKINEHFSLKVLDQATVYLIFRDGTTNLKINIGMILDHKEIVDTDTAEVGEVSNSLERFPARTQSLAVLQRSVAHAQRVERARMERESRLRPPEPCLSADKLTAAVSRPLRVPLHCAASFTVTSRTRCCRKPSSLNLYYDTRLS